MNSTSLRLNILFLAYPPPLCEPWLQDVRQALGPRHDLVVFEEQSPWANQFAGVDVVVDQGGVHSTRAMADVVGTVKLWQILGTGFEKFDLEYWRQKRIPVANTPGEFSAIALGECALMLMLMLARRWHETQANLQKGRYYNPMGRELEGAQLLLIGFASAWRWPRGPGRLDSGCQRWTYARSRKGKGGSSTSRKWASPRISSGCCPSAITSRCTCTSMARPGTSSMRAGSEC